MLSESAKDQRAAELPNSASQETRRGPACERIANRKGMEDKRPAFRLGSEEEEEIQKTDGGKVPARAQVAGHAH